MGCYAASGGNSLRTFRDNLSVPSSGVKNPTSELDSWPLKMGPTGCPETSARNYHYLLRDIAEDGCSYLLRGESPKSRIFNVMFSQL
jgi:hypothetical protein